MAFHSELPQDGTVVKILLAGGHSVTGRIEKHGEGYLVVVADADREAGQPVRHLIQLTGVVAISYGGRREG